MIENLRFHHIGIAARSIDKCIKAYGELGFAASEIVIEPSQNVKIAFLSKAGHPLMEVIEPLSDESPVSRIIQNSGTTPYHICYEVDDIEKTAEDLEDKRFRMLFEPLVSEAMDHGLFCYLFSPDIGLIELYQKKS